MHIPNYFTYYQYLLVFPFCICATYYPCICSDVLCSLVLSHLITLGYPERLPCRPCVMLFLPLLTFALHPCKLHIAFSGLWRGDCCCKEFNPSLFNSLTNQGILRFKSSKLIFGYRVILFFAFEFTELFFAYDIFVFPRLSDVYPLPTWLVISRKNAAWLYL